MSLSDISSISMDLMTARTSYSISFNHSHVISSCIIIIIIIIALRYDVLKG